MSTHQSRSRNLWCSVMGTLWTTILLLTACSSGAVESVAETVGSQAVDGEVGPTQVASTQAVESADADPVETAENTAVDSSVIESRPTGGVVPIVSTGGDELRDLIRPGDPSAVYCLVDLGIGPGEFYDATIDELVFPEKTSFFQARYDDGSIVEIRIHPELISGDRMEQAERIAAPISLLPVELRREIERVGFVGGDAAAQADGGGEGIHVYEANVLIRERSSRFEETLFHESVHTSLDDRFAGDPAWLSAQASDGSFLTEYAAQNPQTEDLAETALYAWALLHHPNRVSEADAAAWESLVPARISVITGLLSAPGQGYEPSPPSCS